MNCFTTINILDLIDAAGEDEVKNILSDFSCPKNDEIDNYIRNNAIDFAKRKMSVTHLVMNDKGKVVAFFTLAHKAVSISDDMLSSTARKRIKRYAQIDVSTNSYMVSAFLIAQLGKNYADNIDELPSGNILINKAMEILAKVQRDVGGGVVYLECEDKSSLLSFYQNDNNCFRPFDERYSESDRTKYIQLLRFF